MTKYIIGSIKAKTAKIALKYAHERYPGYNATVKLYARDYPVKGVNLYNAYSTHQMSVETFKKLNPRK